ncbi:MAG: hypothetical protein K2L42_01235 [Clostridia bacterium]|nr:hypothetical protein [Clostridia bacterium]
MKKVIAGIVSAIAVVALCLCLTACSTGIVGTYKFSKMSMTQGGLSVEIKAGQEYMGVKVSEDAYVLEVKDDNTFVLKVNMGDEMTQTGTWEEKEGKYIFTADGESMEVTLDGNVLSFAMEGIKLELKK